MPTRERIEDLKYQWRADPCWDIEDTAGFEEHHDELKTYREKCEQEWREQEQARKNRAAKNLGIPGNMDLLHFLEKLERKIEMLEERVRKLEDEQ